MSRQKLWIAAALGASALFFVFAPAGRALSDGITQVIVTNWPDEWKVKGEVKLTEPVRLAKLEAFRDILVAPVQPTETTRLVEAGTLTTEGFPAVVLSIHGIVKGTVQRPGQVGVILVPDEASIQEAFSERGLVHFPLEAVTGEIDARTIYFTSNQPHHLLAFSSYRILFYNTTDKTVTAHLFAYLTQ